MVDVSTQPALFYPCCGDDLHTPIELFAPFVHEFWFADLHFFTGEQPDRIPHLLHDIRWTLLDIQITRWDVEMTETGDPKPGEVAPILRSEYYEDFSTGDVIAVHRRKGYAVSALHKHISQLGVFFYRGDNWQKNHGSGLLWNTPHRTNHWGHIDDVLDWLVDGGLYVTDGSNCIRTKNPYAPLAQFRDQYIGIEAVQLAQPFETDRARFECVGYAGHRYGPTLIWQVWKKHG